MIGFDMRPNFQRLGEIIILLVYFAMSTSTFAQQKLAQAGMKWLTVGTDARASALAGAVTATEGYSSAMFYNPAGMSRLSTGVNVAFGKTLWIADIDYSYASVAIRPGDGEWGVFGLSVQGVDYGDLTARVRSETDPRGYIETGTFTPSAWMIGLGYARAFGDKFSIGGNVKYAKQNLGSGYTQIAGGGLSGFKDYSVDVYAFDLGVLYHTGYKSLTFGMSVRNFSKEISYIKEEFQLPLTFRIGLSMDVMDWFDMNKEQQGFLLTVDAEHPRDYQEQIRIGGEYTFFKLVAFRAGYISGTNEEGVSLGIGALKAYNDEGGTLGADYAYTPFGVFGNVHRFSFQISF